MIFAGIGMTIILRLLDKKARQMAEQNQKLKEVRDRTALPFLKCLQALEATGWDVEAAIRWLKAKHKPVGLTIEEAFYNPKLGIPHERYAMKLNIVSGRMSRETKHSAAFDLFYDGGADPLVITDRPIAIPTGLFTVFEPGYVAIIKEKSGLALKGVELHGGVIDADYRQEWKVIARFAPHTVLGSDSDYQVSHVQSERIHIVQPGEKIAQVIFVKLVDVESESPGFITKDQIREGGLGSTGAR